jgi:hypothetical protein
MLGRPDETISGWRETVLKQTRPSLPIDQERVSIMLVSILNTVYREFLKSALPGIDREGARQ